MVVWTVANERRSGQNSHIRGNLLGIFACFGPSRPVSPAAISLTERDIFKISRSARLTISGNFPRRLRSTFRDWAAELTDFPREVAEAALAHVVRNQVEAAYRRGDLFKSGVHSWTLGTPTTCPFQLSRA